MMMVNNLTKRNDSMKTFLFKKKKIDLISRTIVGSLYNMLKRISPVVKTHQKMIGDSIVKKEILPLNQFVNSTPQEQTIYRIKFLASKYQEFEPVLKDFEDCKISAIECERKIMEIFKDNVVIRFGRFNLDSYWQKFLPKSMVGLKNHFCAVINFEGLFSSDSVLYVFFTHKVKNHNLIDTAGKQLVSKQVFISDTDFFNKDQSQMATGAFFSMEGFPDNFIIETKNLEQFFDLDTPAGRNFMRHVIQGCVITYEEQNTGVFITRIIEQKLEVEGIIEEKHSVYSESTWFSSIIKGLKEGDKEEIVTTDELIVNAFKSEPVEKNKEQTIETNKKPLEIRKDMVQPVAISDKNKKWAEIKPVALVDKLNKDNIETNKEKEFFVKAKEIAIASRIPKGNKVPYEELD